MSVLCEKTNGMQITMTFTSSMTLEVQELVVFYIL